MRTLTIKCEAEGSRITTPLEWGERDTGLRHVVGSSRSRSSQSRSRFTFNEHNGDMSYGPFFDNEKLRISTAVGPDLWSLWPDGRGGQGGRGTIAMSCQHLAMNANAILH